MRQPTPPINAATEDGSGIVAAVTVAVTPAGEVLVKVCTELSESELLIGTLSIDELESVVPIGGLFSSLSRTETTNISGVTPGEFWLSKTSNSILVVPAEKPWKSSLYKLVELSLSEIEEPISPEAKPKALAEPVALPPVKTKWVIDTEFGMVAEPSFNWKSRKKGEFGLLIKLATFSSTWKLKVSACATAGARIAATATANLVRLRVRCAFIGMG